MAAKVPVSLEWKPDRIQRLWFQMYQCLGTSPRRREFIRHFEALHPFEWQRINPRRFAQLIDWLFKNGHARTVMERFVSIARRHPSVLKRTFAWLARTVALTLIKTVLRCCLWKLTGLSQTIWDALKYLYDLICDALDIREACLA
jgi:hypothetical protein